MKIVVFIKQVLDNTKLKFSNGQPVTDGVPMMMNPFDEYALETALRLKEQAGGESTVTVITLGAAGAKEMIKKAIAAGADAAYLISDPATVDADSLSIAQVLAAAAKALIPDFELLVFGQMALDDASAQTGPAVAEILDLPSVTAGKNGSFENGQLKIIRETERGVETATLTLPASICMMKCDYELRSSNIKGVMKANKTDIPVKTLADIGADAIPASRSRIEKTWQRPAKSGGRVVTEADPQAAVTQILDYLKAVKIL